LDGNREKVLIYKGLFIPPGSRWNSVLKTPSPPLSCSEPEMRLPLGAFFFLSQRRLAETPEPRRLAPGPISVSKWPFVSNRANLAPSGSASRRAAFSTGFAGPSTMDSASVLPVGVGGQRTRGRHSQARAFVALRQAYFMGGSSMWAFSNTRLGVKGFTRSLTFGR